MQYVSYCNWFISLSIISSRFIYGFTNGRISFFSKVEQKSLVIRMSLFIYLFIYFMQVNGPGFFPPMDILSNAAMNVGCT
jgi:hypothetical protein